MNEWQPISTAPKDGTEFLAFGPGRGKPKVMICGWVEWQSEGREPRARFYAAPNKFVGAPKLTHWMPLPEPPKAD